jgi:hypothetical protein
MPCGLPSEAGSTLCFYLEGVAGVTGIQFATDAKRRKVALQIDLKKYGAILDDLSCGFAIS